MKNGKNTGNEVMPTATATPARVRMFQPSQRPQERRETITTAWGTIKIEGRIGQRHADLLDATLYTALKSRKISDGGIELLVDPAAVRRLMSAKQYSYEQIKRLYVDLENVRIELKTQKMHVLGGIIDHVVLSEATRSNPLNGEKRRLWRVRLNIAFVQLIENDIKLYYNPAPVAALKNGVSQAVARHILSHRQEPQGGWRLDTLIAAVAGDLNDAQMRDKRREIRADTATLAQIDIHIEGDRVHRAM